MIEISDTEAMIIVKLLKSFWVPLEYQKAVLELINRIEKRLSE